MMENMSSAGMGTMKGLPGMTGSMGSGPPMMGKRLEMMQTMVKMMMDRMPAAPAKQVAARPGIQNRAPELGGWHGSGSSADPCPCGRPAARALW